MQQPDRASLWRALAFVRPHRAAVVFICSITLAVGSMQALEPMVLGRFFDAVLPPGDLAAAGRLLGSVAALALSRELLSSAGSWLTWRTRIKLQEELLTATVARLERLPLSFHRQQGIGETMTLVDRGIQSFVGALAEVAFQVLPAIVYLAISVAVMVRMEPRLALAVGVLAPLPPLIGALAAPEQSRRERDLLHRWRTIYGRFHEVLGGIVTVRSFGMEDVEQQRFVREVGAANALVVRGLAIDNGVGALRNVLVALTRLVALGWGGWMVLHGQTTSGTVLAFVAYVSGLFGPVQGLTGAYQTISRAQAALEAIFGILDLEDDPPDAAEPTPLPDLAGEVRFERVTYCYHPGAPPAVDDLDLHVQPGEQVALVGASGSGKTTLVSLLQRLHDPTSGRILLDGVDLRTLDQRALRQRIGVVLQDGLLFNDTARANLAYGRPDATLDQIRAAARAAHADGFLSALPQGYDTVLGDRGSLLSVGQRQRVAIARALLKDPPLLILDEATSALDAESEAFVQEALELLLHGRTSFVIAHRLTTAVGADRIVVLDKGRLVEQGTHAELLQLDGRYASLVRRQVRGLIAAGVAHPG